MKRTILFAAILAGAQAAAASNYVTAMVDTNTGTVKPDVLEDRIAAGEAGGGGSGSTSMTVRSVDAAGDEIAAYTNIATIDFNADTGLFVTNPATRRVRISLGSYWKDLYIGTNVYTPTGEQPIRIELTPMTNVWIDDTTDPWTLYIPQGRQGAKGDPGTWYGVYRGAWAFGQNYVAGDWMLYSGSGYGAVTNFTSDSAYPTNDTAYGTALVRLWYSGQDGSSGAPGVGLVVQGDWDSEHGAYNSTDLVRDGGSLWYTTTGASSQPSMNTNEWTLLLRDGADGIAAVITSNTVWGGRFDPDGLYQTNVIVYAPYNPYGGYIVSAEYNGATYEGDPGDTRLADTDFFTKIWHYAKDGAAGSSGEPGTHGTDGAGNMWFDRAGYQADKEYSNGVVLVHSGATYIFHSLTPATGVEPGNFSANPDWTNQWQAGAEAGMDGGNWLFSDGFNPPAGGYSTNDVVVTTDAAGLPGAFWLCNGVGVTTHPTNSTPGDWSLLTSPAYRSFPLLSPPPLYNGASGYATNELVRYQDGNGAWGTYACIQATTGNTPLATAFWTPIASGVIGPAGAPGTVTTYYFYTNLVSNVWAVTTNYTTNIVNTFGTNYYFTNVTQTTTNFYTNNYFTTNRYTTDVSDMSVDWQEGSSNYFAIGPTSFMVRFKTDYSGTTNISYQTNGAAPNAYYTNDGFVIVFPEYTPSSGASTNIGDGLIGNGGDEPLAVDGWDDLTNNAALGATAHGWGNPSGLYVGTNDPAYTDTVEKASSALQAELNEDLDYANITNPPNYRVNDTNHPASVEYINFPDGSTLSSANFGDIPVSNFPPNLAVTDDTNNWTEPQTFPEGTVVPGYLTDSAAEGAPYEYAATNSTGTNYIKLLAGTNSFNQLIPAAAWTNPVIITVPERTNTATDVGIWLRYTKGATALTWTTNHGRLASTEVPVSSTSGVTRLRIWCDVGSTNFNIRRQY